MPTKTVTSKILMAELKRLGYDFRVNIMDDSLEVSDKPITDLIRARIRRDLRDLGYNRHLTAAEDAYLSEGDFNSYHPIRDKLDSLVWDGLPHIHLLSNYFTELPNHCNGQTPVFEIFFNRWLIGAVAKILDSKQNAMLVFDGPQGIGKSQFVRWLAKCFPEQFFIEKSINPGDKDDEVRLISKVIWEVAELGSTARRADREALKHFISQRQVTVRKPYGHYDVYKPALASLIGTINNEAGFLSDPTGNRRFLVCTIEKINWDYTEIDIDQIWAEAVSKYKSGQESEVITDKEIELQKCLNEKYMIDDPFIIGLQQKCLADPDNTTNWASSNDILIYLGYDPPRRADTMALGSAAKKLGLTKGNAGYNGKIRGYYGVFIPIP